MTTKPTLASIKDANAAAGDCYFAPFTIKAFGIRFPGPVCHGPGGTYFIEEITQAVLARQNGYNIRRAYNGGAEIKLNGSAHSLETARTLAKAFAADPDRA